MLELGGAAPAADDKIIADVSERDFMAEVVEAMPLRTRVT